jgi:hypothetical protein
MKLAFITTFLMALTASAALLPQKSVIVSYGSNTPASVVQQAKDAITAAVSFRPKHGFKVANLNH